MISDIEVIIEKFKKGEMVILVDDEDRENEGDLIVSSQYLTPEHINFMITYAKGLVCAPIAKDVAKKLKLSLMQGIITKKIHNLQHLWILWSMGFQQVFQLMIALKPLKD